MANKPEYKKYNVIRNSILDGLYKLDDVHKDVFRRMYDPKNLYTTYTHIVDNMSNDMLDIATIQIKNTLSKYYKKDEKPIIKELQLR